MNYRWDWGILIQHPYLDWLISGTLLTLGLALVAWAIAFPLGILIGVLRTLPNRPLRWVGTAYVQLFRNIPLIVQMFLWFFVVPEFLPGRLGLFIKRGLTYPEFTMAALCLGFYTAARVAETVRAGLDSVGRGPTKAGLSTGLTLRQTYMYILVPVALRLTAPPMISEFLTVFKNTSVALTIGVLELTMQANQIENYTFHGFEAFAAATLIYALISFIGVYGGQRLTKRFALVGMVGQDAS